MFSVYVPCFRKGLHEYVGHGYVHFYWTFQNVPIKIAIAISIAIGFVFLIFYFSGGMPPPEK